MRRRKHRAGTSAPLGATVTPEGVNFSVFSRSATAVELLLFEDAEAAASSRVFWLDPRQHQTYHYWHVLVQPRACVVLLAPLPRAEDTFRS